MPLSGLFCRTLLMCLCLVAAPCAAQRGLSVIDKKYSPAQLVEDATLLRNVTLAMHPAIGLYQPRAFYEQLFDRYIQGLNDSLTEREFRMRTKLVMEELHCGHTEVLYSRAYYKAMNRKKLNFSPYIFLPVGGKVYVMTNLNKKADSTLHKGNEVLAINGIATDSMLRYCKRFISADGYNTTSKDHYLQLGFNSYYTSLFGRPDTFSVNYRDGKEIRTLRYPAFRPKSFPPLPLGPKDDSLFVHYKRAAMRYRYLDSTKSTLLLKIARFSRQRSDKAYRKVFRKLHKANTRHLVIDLRNNGGGSLENAYNLLSYLVDSNKTQTLRTTIRNYPYKRHTRGNVFFKLTRFAFKIIGKKVSRNDTDYFVYTIRPRKKHHFNGKVIVLINGGSFSASCLVAAYLKDRSNTVFVGEETGGAVEGCNAGITPYYKLPNTDLRVRMPAFRIVHDVSPQITGHGILPDHTVSYTINDILTRQDLELKKVKDLLK